MRVANQPCPPGGAQQFSKSAGTPAGTSACISCIYAHQTETAMIWYDLSKEAGNHHTSIYVPFQLMIQQVNAAVYGGVKLMECESHHYCMPAHPVTCITVILQDHWMLALGWQQPHPLQLALITAPAAGCRCCKVVS